MKRILYHATRVAAGLCLLTAASACTGNFEDINKRKDRPALDDLSVYEQAGLLFGRMIDLAHNGQENTSQMIDQMVGNQYGGYMNCTNNFGNGGNYNTLDPRPGWTGNTFNDQFSVFYSNYNQVVKITGGRGYVTAWAEILRVAVMVRIADTYGPIPYSRVSPEVSLTPYDNVQDLYHNMIGKLTEAIAAIRNDPASKNAAIAPWDNVYGGDFTKWIKFANSLKLRLAVRIALRDEAYSKGVIAEVLADTDGAILSNTDNAAIPAIAAGNPYNKSGQEWGDLSISATLTTYMNGLDDPRLPVYMTELDRDRLRAADRNGVVADKDGLPKYIGVWMGADCDLPAGARDMYGAFSDPGPKGTVGRSWPMTLFCAAETNFLLAEAALRGWIAGGDAGAKGYYEAGIRTSMDQHVVSLGGYMTASITAGNGGYTDPVHPAGTFNLVTSAGGVPINVAWDANTTAEMKIEAIITQKWLANFTLGFEAWCDFRRTGYPRLFPSARNLSTTTDAVLNPSTDLITTNAVRMVRRLPYPQTEYANNSANVEAAVGMLGGGDKMSTELWWAKGNQ